MRTITILTNQGPVEVQAEGILGPIAVTPSTQLESGLVLTHIPSGKRIGEGVTFPNLTAALTAARKLLPLTNWSQLVPTLTEEITTSVRALLDENGRRA